MARLFWHIGVDADPETAQLPDCGAMHAIAGHRRAIESQPSLVHFLAISFKVEAVCT
jgi:hypothetical protein